MSEEIRRERLLSLDWLRGFVMALMALDHASMFFNNARVAQDTALYNKVAVLPLAQFLTRFVTHLCAPTFAFLVGTAIALRIAKLELTEGSAASIDRYLLTRGAFLVLIDLTLFSLASSRVLMQVLYALGMGMLAMVLLRRLTPKICLGLALGWMFLGEALMSLLWLPTSGNASLWFAPLIGVHFSKAAIVIYPAIHWIAIVTLGYCFGHYLHKKQAAGLTKQASKLLFIAGGLGLAIFGVVRGLNGYGNMGMLRDASKGFHPIAEWLYVSKYPPSLSFLALILGIMALILAATMLRKESSFQHNGPIIVFGQTALFFYLLHFILLTGAAAVAGKSSKVDLVWVFPIALVLLIVLYPICRWYRGYKATHNNVITRYI